jgi:hypothetical protein
MKMSQAITIIGGEQKKMGYRVHFELAENGLLKSDFFPDRGEDLIPTEAKAWDLAKLFAKKT